MPKAHFGRNSKAFELAAGPNAEFWAVKPDHLATYYGEAFENSVDIQIRFLKRVALAA